MTTTSSSGSSVNVTWTTNSTAGYAPPPAPLQLNKIVDPIDVDRLSYVQEALREHVPGVQVNTITGNHSGKCTCGEEYDLDIQGAYALHIARIALRASDTWDMLSMDGDEESDDDIV